MNELPVHNFIFQHSRRHCPNTLSLGTGFCIPDSKKSAASPMNHVMTSSCTSSSSSNFQECGEHPMFHLRSQWSPETHLLPVRSAWETSARNPSVSSVWRNAPRIWRDFGWALPFQTRLIQTKPVLPLSNEHGSQVKDQGRRQCCHNKQKKFPYRPTRDVYILSGHASYINNNLLFIYCAFVGINNKKGCI